ncbi:MULTISPECIES: hypothetical protein [Streptomyces]|uniref:hypothetical protein n=1 Tax=Streptomyces TaxID=1883 RepID=UPI00093E3EAE|nr:hypothetical protein [Streptomyces sp. MJM1172]OKI61551.1 hypothetical protein AMK15_18755 [Streptomyces sp. MJM1172]
MQLNQFVVPYQAVSFPIPPGLNGTHRLVFTADALAHALFTTGRAPGNTANHGWASVFEWLHRVALMPAYLRRRPDGRIARSDLARELDRSEKVALSYAVGQAMTGIFATQLLDVRFLMHVDRYGGSYQLVVPPKTKSRPDLFGQRRNGGWVVAEAKGRSSPIDANLKSKMRSQKRMIRSVAGVPPEIAYGCCAYFEKATNGAEWLRMYSVDPEENEPEAIDFRVSSPDQFIAAYYAPFLTALKAGEPVSDSASDYLTASFGPFGIRVSLLRSVAERVQAAQGGLMRGLRDDVLDLLPDAAEWEMTPGHFADGTGLVTKWTDAFAQHDWGGVDERW